MRKNHKDIDTKKRYIGAIVGGAIGDGMGYIMENISDFGLEEYIGKEGIKEPFVDQISNKSFISDDTQMVLFTMDGMEWAYIRCQARGIGTFATSGVWQSLARWYYTQTGIILDEYIMHKHEHEPVALSSIGVKTILEYDELYNGRGASNESLMAIESGNMGTIMEPQNNFCDCSCLSRVSPAGLLLHDDPGYAFDEACNIAAITHGNPTGYLSAGTYAHIIAGVLNGRDLDVAVREALYYLKNYEYIDEVNDCVEYALHLSEADYDEATAKRLLGAGNSAHEALAIAVYCALKGEDYESVVRMAANWNGNLSAIACVAGTLAGALVSCDAINQEWQKHVELYDMMLLWIDRFFKLKDY